MSYVVINAITVPAGQSDELARRFASRAGMVEQSDGFEQFDLLRPADGRDQWLVITRWRDEEAFQAWMASASFGQAHGRGATAEATAGGESGAPTGAAGHPAGGHPGASAGHPGSAHGGGHPGGNEGGPPPVATANEIWAFSVEQHSQAPA